MKSERMFEKIIFRSILLLERFDIIEKETIFSITLIRIDVILMMNVDSCDTKKRTSPSTCHRKLADRLLMMIMMIV
jgi:hypothetical protein